MENWRILDILPHTLLSKNVYKTEILQKVVDGLHSGDLLLEFFGTLHQFTVFVNHPR